MSGLGGLKGVKTALEREWCGKLDAEMIANITTPKP